jgi:hypothetical protein
MLNWIGLVFWSLFTVHQVKMIIRALKVPNGAGLRKFYLVEIPFLTLAIAMLGFYVLNICQ